MMVKIAVFFEVFAFAVCLVISLFIVLIPVGIMKLLRLRKAAATWSRISGTEIGRASCRERV